MKVLIVNAEYYKNLNSSILTSVNSYLKKNKIKYSTIKVTGVFEIPVVISKYINKYDGFIALGCVIKGETPHFDLICKATFNGLMDLSITKKKPIGNGIITALNFVQAKKRCKVKGIEAAKAVKAVLNNVPSK